MQSWGLDYDGMEIIIRTLFHAFIMLWGGPSRRNCIYLQSTHNNSHKFGRSARWRGSFRYSINNIGSRRPSAVVYFREEHINTFKILSCVDYCCNLVTHFFGNQHLWQNVLSEGYQVAPPFSIDERWSRLADESLCNKPCLCGDNSK